MKATIRMKHVHTDKDRHGNIRYYYQKGRGAPKIRLRAPYGSAAFLAEYHAAMSAATKPGPRKSIYAAGTFGAVILAYCASPEFASLRKSTQDVRRRVLDHLRDAHGHKRTAHLERRHVRGIRNEKAETPNAANNLLKILKALFKWAVDADLMETNPASDVSAIKVVTDGHHAWTADEIAAFKKKHPSGSKARLAFVLMLYTLARKSDAVTFGRQMIADGALRYRCQKTQRWVTTHIAKQVWTEINALPADQMTFLLTERGAPFTVNGFGNWFRERCDEAGLTNCSAHGLRKAGATMAAEGGASSSTLQALGGWANLKDPSRYTQTADQAKLAAAGVAILEQKDDE